MSQMAELVSGPAEAVGTQKITNESQMSEHRNTSHKEKKEQKGKILLEHTNTRNK